MHIWITLNWSCHCYPNIQSLCCHWYYPSSLSHSVPGFTTETSSTKIMLMMKEKLVVLANIYIWWYDCYFSLVQGVEDPISRTPGKNHNPTDPTVDEHPGQPSNTSPSTSDDSGYDSPPVSLENNPIIKREVDKVKSLFDLVANLPGREQNLRQLNRAINRRLLV